ncbi:MAG TPA: cysteine desulfurase-like protein [Candidatus Deferrimicrobiaceae bacterium]|nr:cysteine desulfurase-like protein [Candidatus Deferrimicrobiaceae bacterium]
MPSFDVEAIRTRFSALSTLHDGRPMAFFDGPGGTQVPESVIAAVAAYYRESNANHGGAFATSARSDAIVAEAHAAIADLLGVATDEIVLGANMTTLTFHLSRSIAATLRPGDEIVVTGLDHQANVDPWLAVATDRGLVVRTWEPRLDDCTLQLGDLDALLTERSRLVAVGWASNAVGTINPIAEVARRAHAVGAWLYVDAVHAAPHLPLDARAVDADFVACSVYKFFGPHVGAVYGRRDILERLPPYKVRPAEHRFETGTGNFEGAAGSLAAVDYLADLGLRYGGAAPTASRRERLVAGMTAIRAYELELYASLEERREALPGVRLHGLRGDANLERRTPTAAITIEGHTPRAVAAHLGERGIAVWDGDFYATGLIERLGLAPEGVVRIGLTHYNTRAEVDRLVDELADLVRMA